MSALFKNLRIGSRLAVLLAFLLVVIAAIGLTGATGITRVAAEMKSVYEDRTVPLTQLSDILDNFHRIRMAVLSLVQSEDQQARVGLAEDIRKFDEQIRLQWDAYRATSMTDDEAKLVAAMEAQMKEFKAARDITVNAVLAGDLALARANFKDNAGAKYRVTLDSIRALIRLQETVSKQDYIEAERTAHTVLIATIVLAVTGTLLGMALAFLIVRSITVPVDAMTGAMGDLAAGRLEVEVPATDRGDEIGAMAKAVQVFKLNALERKRLEEQERDEAARRDLRQKRIEALTREFESMASAMLGEVRDAVETLHQTSRTLSANAEETERQSQTVSAATEQASANVATVSTATSELSASIQEISRQVQNSATIANNASGEARHTNAKIASLADAAQRIGQVVELISDIANQTNLLALNATIEAARAGDAGKGFAVVANEVKNLANQTARATHEISEQIGAVQSETDEAVNAIQGITATIQEVNEMAATIASAVEEQGAATSEIARNVEQASAGTREVSTNIAGVVEAATVTGDMAHQVLSAADRMKSASDRLGSHVDRFLSDVRAA